MTPDQELSPVEGVFRDAYGQAVATLVRVFGDIDLAEEAVQSAFVVASERWPADGIPPNPPGWIITTARRRAIDHLRRARRGRELTDQAAAMSDTAEPGVLEPGLVKDDQLRLIFTCCHPALRPEHQVALTLRLLGGLSVEEIARSFLVGEAAMAKRLVRAKYKIRAAEIPYRVPANHDLPVRLKAVLSVLYLIYNTGADDAERGALRPQAIRLARELVRLMPDEPEAAGLLALMLLSESRAEARLHDGGLVLLKDQDRARWNRALIEEGQAIVRACIERNRPGPFQLQAAIQAVHSHARSYDTTDWSQILELYDHLYTLMPTHVVALNRAIALGEVEGAEPALAALDAVAPHLEGYHLLEAARAEMLHRLGRTEAARVAYETALDQAATDKDRRSLRSRLDQLDAASAN